MSSTPRSFLPAAQFLLELAWHNLFEEADAREGNDPQTYRCKGCGEILGRVQRKQHFKHHQRVERNRKARELKRARERALAKARKARRHQTEGRLA